MKGLNYTLPIDDSSINNIFNVIRVSQKTHRKYGVFNMILNNKGEKIKVTVIERTFNDDSDRHPYLRIIIKYNKFDEIGFIIGQNSYTDTWCIEKYVGGKKKRWSSLISKGYILINDDIIIPSYTSTKYGCLSVNYIDDIITHNKTIYHINMREFIEKLFQYYVCNKSATSIDGKDDEPYVFAQHIHVEGTSDIYWIRMYTSRIEIFQCNSDGKSDEEPCYTEKVIGADIYERYNYLVDNYGKNIKPESTSMTGDDLMMRQIIYKKGNNNE